MKGELKTKLFEAVKKLYKEEPDLTMKEMVERVNSIDDFAGVSVKWFHIHKIKKDLGLVGGGKKGKRGPAKKSKPAQSEENPESIQIPDELPTFAGLIEKAEAFIVYAKKLKAAQEARLKQLFL